MTIAVMIQAISAPPRPYQTPLYRNGRRTNASLPPTSLVTSISSRRFWMSSRMVLPTITITPSASNAAVSISAALDRLQDGVQAIDPRGIELHHVHRRQSRGCRRKPFEIAPPSRTPRGGRTTSVCGSGFSFSASIAAPNPESRRNSFSASSASDELDLRHVATLSHPVGECAALRRRESVA